MNYLHTMVRVSDLEKALAFYCDALGLIETRRYDNETARFTLVFLAAPQDINQENPESSPLLELTYNWDKEDYSGGRNFGHLAFGVDNIYDFCDQLIKHSITINRPPKDGYMAFIKSPDGISIELLQKGSPLPIKEPWASMPSSGAW